MDIHSIPNGMVADRPIMSATTTKPSPGVDLYQHQQPRLGN